MRVCEGGVSKMYQTKSVEKIAKDVLEFVKSDKIEENLSVVKKRTNTQTTLLEGKYYGKNYIFMAYLLEAFPMHVSKKGFYNHYFCRISVCKDPYLGHFPESS